jgi:hypothetical protein
MAHIASLATMQTHSQLLNSEYMRKNCLSSMMHIALALSVGACSVSALAVEQQFTCPEKIDSSHLQFSYSADGWTPFVGSHLRLSGVGFMQAAPEKMAHLKPEVSSKYAKHDSETWRFEGEYPQGKWLTCGYEQNTVSLSKRIDDAVSECTVTTVIEKKYRNKNFEIRCK